MQYWNCAESIDVLFCGSMVVTCGVKIDLILNQVGFLDS